MTSPTQTNTDTKPQNIPLKCNPNPHPYGIKSTSSGLLARSNLVSVTEGVGRHYVPLCNSTGWKSKRERVGEVGRSLSLDLHTQLLACSENEAHTTPHPYGIKSTSSGLLARSNLVSVTEGVGRHYVPLYNSTRWKSKRERVGEVGRSLSLDSHAQLLACSENEAHTTHARQHTTDCASTITSTDPESIADIARTPTPPKTASVIASGVCDTPTRSPVLSKTRRRVPPVPSTKIQPTHQDWGDVQLGMRMRCSDGRGIGSGYERERERGRARGRENKTTKEDGMGCLGLGVAVVLVVMWIIFVNLV